MNKQKGFTTLEFILIILVIGIVGFGGYYVWSQNRDDNQDVVVNDMQDLTPNDETSEEADVLAIPELGIAVRLNENTKDYTYFVNNEEEVKYAYFQLERVDEALESRGLVTVSSEGCSFAAISLFDSADELESGDNALYDGEDLVDDSGNPINEYVKRIDESNFYYTVTGSQSLCGGYDTATEDWETKYEAELNLETEARSSIIEHLNDSSNVYLL